MFVTHVRYYSNNKNKERHSNKLQHTRYISPLFFSHNHNKKNEQVRKKKNKIIRCMTFEIILTCAYVCHVCQGSPAEGSQEEQWIPITGVGFTKADQFCVSVRRLQQRTGCSDIACKDIIQTLGKHLRLDKPVNIKETDKKLQKTAWTRFLRLHGCVGCHRHVFAAKRKHCPSCGHARYNSKGQPFEEVFYFPSKPRIKSLLKLPDGGDGMGVYQVVMSMYCWWG